MQHFQTNFDLFTKLFMVIGACSFFQALALLNNSALDYIAKIFTLIQVKGPNGSCPPITIYVIDIAIVIYCYRIFRVR